MVITDMRMESDASGAEVIAAARSAPYHPAVALLTAFPMAEDDWQVMGADKMLVKPMHTRILLQQLEKLLASHEAKLSIWSSPAPPKPGTAPAPVVKKTAKAAKTKAPSSLAKKSAQKPQKKVSAGKTVAKKTSSKNAVGR
jgi:DNA-binding response OmpR family regulator